MTRAGIEGLCERLERRSAAVSNLASVGLINPDGPEAATALRAMLAREEAMREALDGATVALIGLHIATGKKSATAETAIEKASGLLAQGAPDHA